MPTINDLIIARIEENFGAVIPKELKNKISRKLEEMRSYTPKVGVFGKTGVGKSSLCNALFGSDVCPISDVEACTREPQKVLLELGGAGIQLVDLPGLGETPEHYKKCDALYQSLLPDLDLILWVFRGDDRATAFDEYFYKRIICRYVEAGKPFVAVINQVDRIYPSREWDWDEKKPGPGQLTNIEEKRQDIAGLLGISMSKVIAVSANERYGLVELVDSVVHELPNKKKWIVLETIKAVEEAEIAAAQAKAAEAQAKAEEMKAKAEVERMALEKQIAKLKAEQGKQPTDGVTEVWLRVAPEVAHYFSRSAMLPQQQQYPSADGSLLVSTHINHVSQLLPLVRYWLPHVRVVHPVEWHKIMVQGLHQDLAKWEI